MMPHRHHDFFVLLSVVVAVLGSWTALDLFKRVRSHIGRAQRVWLATAAVAMGSSIWSMHFIAMLGFDPGSPVSYDLPLTFLSLALAIGATSGAFFAASRERASTGRLALAGLAMGFGICLMHYVGMAALRTAVSLGYQPAFVAASFVIAVAASAAALTAARRERSLRWRAAAALILGLAIVGMHYTAMAGLKLTVSEVSAVAGAPPLVLGFSVAAGTLVILFLALLASLYDQRLNVLGALEGGGVGYWELSLPDMALQVSAGGKEIMGWPSDKPLTQADIVAMLSREDRERRAALLTAAIEQGAEYDAEFPIRSGEDQPRWVNIRGRVVARRSGRPGRMAGVVLDITDRRRAFQAVADAEQRQRLLIDELNHRVKNTLATVQSIARQTTKSAASVEHFSQAFEARLRALSHAHNALTRGSWEAASLRELLTQELSPYGPEHARLSGGEVMLKPRQTLSLGMLFHELATNAAKYGPLSRPGGWVEVSWQLNDQTGRLDLEWKERGGPPASAPTRQGFGTRLVNAVVVSELGGEVSSVYDEQGFSCRLSVPTD